jgi:hypothetical protein
LEREFGRALTKLPDWTRRHARPNGRGEERFDLTSHGVSVALPLRQVAGRRDQPLGIP